MIANDEVSNHNYSSNDKSVCFGFGGKIIATAAVKSDTETAAEDREDVTTFSQLIKVIN